MLLLTHWAMFDSKSGCSGFCCDNIKFFTRVSNESLSVSSSARICSRSSSVNQLSSSLFSPSTTPSTRSASPVSERPSWKVAILAFKLLISPSNKANMSFIELGLELSTPQHWALLSSGLATSV